MRAARPIKQTRNRLQGHFVLAEESEGNMSDVTTVFGGRSGRLRQVSLADYIKKVQPTYCWSEFHRRFVDVLERWARGETPNPYLMILIPVRHGKSLATGELLTGWEIGCHSQDADPLLIIQAAYNLEQTGETTLPLRRLMRTEGYQRLFPGLKPDRRMENRRAFNVLAGRRICAKHRSAGKDSGIIGKGAHRLLMDDVLRGRNEAESLAYRNEVWRWIVSDLFSRLQPGARVLMIGSRWHVDDPSGRMLEGMRAARENPQWDVVCLPALLDAETQASETWQMGMEGPLPDWRKVGEPLWPERFGLDVLRDKALDPYTWAAQWQQRPMTSETRKLDANWFRGAARVANDDPRIAKCQVWVRGIDIAVGQTTHSNHTAGVLLGLGDGYLVLRHVYRVRLEWTEARRVILANAQRDGLAVRLCFGVGGQIANFVDGLKKEDGAFRQFRVDSIQELGAKITRALEWAPLAAGGKVLMVEGPWNEDWLREVGDFTGCDDLSDDQIDAFWDAYQRLAELAPSRIAKMLQAAPAGKSADERGENESATRPAQLAWPDQGRQRRTFL